MAIVKKAPLLFVALACMAGLVFVVFGWVAGLFAAGFVPTVAFALNRLDKTYDQLTPKVTRGDISILDGFVKLAVPFYLTLGIYAAVAIAVIAWFAR